MHTLGGLKSVFWRGLCTHKREKNRKKLYYWQLFIRYGNLNQNMQTVHTQNELPCSHNDYSTNWDDDDREVVLSRRFVRITRNIVRSQNLLPWFSFSFLNWLYQYVFKSNTCYFFSNILETFLYKIFLIWEDNLRVWARTQIQESRELFSYRYLK